MRGRHLVARLVRVLNRTRGTVLSERCRVADDPVSRGVGLLLTGTLAPGEGLLLTKTSAITMLGMRYAIDVVFLDASVRVVDVAPRLMAWVPVRVGRGARDTLELPVGALAASATQVGDECVIEALG